MAATINDSFTVSPNSPMERLFRSFKTEWLPSTGYMTAQEAQRDISHYTQQKQHSTNKKIQLMDCKFNIQVKGCI